MTNEHIELVKRWLAGNSVSQDDLKAAAKATDKMRRAVGATDAAEYTAHAVAYAAASWDTADADSEASWAAAAARWVKRYEELFDETRN